MIKRTAFFVLTIFTAVLIAKESHFWAGKTMEYKKAKLNWGEQEFDFEKFKNGDEKIRAPMAVSALKSKSRFLNKTPDELFNLIGRPDGFFFFDSFPAYLISRNYNQGESWQVVFLLDIKGKVSDVIIHRNSPSD